MTLADPPPFLIQYGPDYPPEEIAELERDLDRRGIPAQLEPTDVRAGVGEVVAGLVLNVVATYTADGLRTTFLCVLAAVRRRGARARPERNRADEPAVALQLPASSVFVLTGDEDDARLESLTEHLPDLELDATYVWNPGTGTLVREDELAE
jgi:hypothetical protein